MSQVNNLLCKIIKHTSYATTSDDVSLITISACLFLKKDVMFNKIDLKKLILLCFHKINTIKNRDIVVLTRYRNYIEV